MSDTDVLVPDPDDGFTPSAPLPFRQLFDAAPAFIAVHESPDHIYIYSNPAHDRIVGGRDPIGWPLRDRTCHTLVPRPVLGSAAIAKKQSALWKIGLRQNLSTEKAQRLQVGGWKLLHGPYRALASACKPLKCSARKSTKTLILGARLRLSANNTAISAFF